MARRLTEGVKKHLGLKPSLFSNGMAIITHNYFDKETLKSAYGSESDSSTGDPQGDPMKRFMKFREGFRNFNDHTAYEDIGQTEAYHLTGEPQGRWT